MAVFAVGLDTVAKQSVGRLEAELSQALRAKGAKLLDIEVLFPPPAPASLEEGDKLFEEGRQLLDNLDLEAAADSFTASAVFLIKRPVEAKPARLSEVLTFLGATLLMQGDKAGAKVAFIRALLLNSEAQPTSELFGPDVADAFTAARLNVSNLPKGKLSIDSVPSGAAVTLDGEPLGFSPTAEQELPIGRHHIILTRPGYVPFGAFPDIVAAKPTEVHPLLEPLPGYAEAVAAAEKLASAPQGEQLLPEARALGAALGARTLVLATLGTGAERPASLWAWDLLSGNRLSGVRFDPDTGSADAAAQVKRWLDQPPPTAAAKLELPPLLGKWWFWAGVGGAAAAVTGVALLARPAGPKPDLVLGLP